MGERPPPDQAHVVAAAFAGDPEHVAVVRLAEAFVRPHGHCVVAVEGAEPAAAGVSRPVGPRVEVAGPAAAGFAGTGGPRPLAAPAEGVALAGVAAEALPLPLLLEG